MKFIAKYLSVFFMIFILMNNVYAENEIPATCTETGIQVGVCKGGSESYDASKNSCWKQPVFRIDNRIKNKDNGYNDYFIDYDFKPPTNGKCGKGYVFGYDDKMKARCFKTVCDDGYRSGGNCIQCKELTTSGSYTGDVPWEIPTAPVDCSAFKEITAPIWKWVRIIAPILAVTLGALDLLKAVTSGDEKGTKKASSDFLKRLGLTALLFLVPLLVNFIVGLIEFNDLSACL